MSDKVEEDFQRTQCPKCSSEIPRIAIVCPVCHSDIRIRTPSEKRRDRFARDAKFVKDWIGFPAAGIAAIVALINPAIDNVRLLFKLDGARINFEFLRPDVINVGLDDTPVPKQADRIVVHIPFWRSALVNDGLSRATVRPEFICSMSADDGSTVTTGRFYFINVDTQKKILADVEAAPKVATYVNVALSDSGSSEEGYNPTKVLNTCELDYSDKYGRKTLVKDFDSKNMLPFAIGGADDSRIKDREQYCPIDTIRGLAIGDEVIDCVNGDGVFAIEPVTLWERALSRILRQTSEFQKLKPGTAERTPNLILITCSESDCAAKQEAMRNALRDFVPKLGVWECPPKTIGLENCTGPQL